jgi:hypothetical protein
MSAASWLTQSTGNMAISAQQAAARVDAAVMMQKARRGALRDRAEMIDLVRPAANIEYRHAAEVEPRLPSSVVEQRDQIFLGRGQLLAQRIPLLRGMTAGGLGLGTGGGALAQAAFRALVARRLRRQLALQAGDDRAERGALCGGSANASPPASASIRRDSACDSA